MKYIAPMKKVITKIAKILFINFFVVIKSHSFTVILKWQVTSRCLRSVAGTLTDNHKYKRKLELTAFFPKEKTTKAIDANSC